MRPELYERLMRVLLSSVLSSNLSSDELRRICKELENNPSFMADFVEALRDLATRISPRDFKTPPKKSYWNDVADNFDLFSKPEMVSFVLERLKTIKLPKSRVVELMSQILPELPQSGNGVQTLHQMVTEFVEMATQQQVKKLLDSTDSTGAGDDYMLGMSRRRKMIGPQ